MMVTVMPHPVVVMRAVAGHVAAGLSDGVTGAATDIGDLMPGGPAGLGDAVADMLAQVLHRADRTRQGGRSGHGQSGGDSRGKCKLHLSGSLPGFAPGVLGL